MENMDKELTILKVNLRRLIGNLKQKNPTLSSISVNIPTLNLGMLRGQQSMNERA